MRNQPMKTSYKPPISPLPGDGYPSWIARPRTDRRMILLPLGLLGFVIILGTLLIMQVVVRAPDTHANLWNEVYAGYDRTTIGYVVSTNPDIDLPPLTASQAKAGGVQPPPVAGKETAAPQGDVLFSRQILPIFQANCQACHGKSVAMKGVSLTSYESLADAQPPLIVPGKPEESLLMGVLRGKPTQMPPSGALPEDKIKLIEEWIRQGGKKD